LLARLLEMPEDLVKVRPGAKGSGPDFLISAGEHTFHVESKSSSARAPLIQAVVLLREKREDKERKVIPLLVRQTSQSLCPQKLADSPSIPHPA